jgi:hypothetical protein
MSRHATLALAARIAEATEAAPQVLEALDFCLTPLSRSAWPEVAWGFSRLTSTRYPVEFGFSTRSDQLRATFEVAGPETPDDQRLDAALELAAALGLPAPSPGQLEGWRRMQSAAPLRWGCWMSLRQTQRGFGAKLYIEAPRGGATDAFPPAPGSRPLMVGFDLGSGSEEYYFAWPCVQAQECAARLTALGVGDIDALMGELEAVIGLPRAAGLGWARLGVSLAGPGRDVALFLDSRAVRGGAAALRRRMMVNRSRGSYPALLGERDDGALPYHGILTLIPRADGVELRASMAADALA